MRIVADLTEHTGLANQQHSPWLEEAVPAFHLFTGLHFPRHCIGALAMTVKGPRGL